MCQNDEIGRTVYGAICDEHNLWLQRHADRVLEYAIRLRGGKREVGSMVAGFPGTEDETRKLRDLTDAQADELAESLHVVAYAAVGLSGTEGP